MSPPPLFEAALGARFAELAPALRRFHRLSGRHELQGVVETDPPASTVGRVLVWCLGSPRQSASGAIRFELDVETWTRHFPARTMRSSLRLVDGRVVERMGPARLVFALDEIDGGLRMRLQAMRFLGIPCPAWLRPRRRATAAACTSASRRRCRASAASSATAAIWPCRMRHRRDRARFRGVVGVMGRRACSAGHTAGQSSIDP